MKKFNNDFFTLLLNIMSIILTIIAIVISFTEYNNSDILLELNNILNNNKDLTTMLVGFLGSILSGLMTFFVFLNVEKERYTKKNNLLLEQCKSKLKEFEHTDYIDNTLENIVALYESSENQNKSNFISKLLSNKAVIFNFLVFTGYILFTLLILTLEPEQVNAIANSFIDTFKQICTIVENNQSLIAVLTAGCTLYAGIFAYNYGRKKQKNDEKKQAISSIEIILNYLYSNFDDINTVFNPNWSSYVNFIDDVDLKLDIIHILHSIEIGKKTNISKSSIKVAIFRLNESNVVTSNPITA